MPIQGGNQVQGSFSCQVSVEESEYKEIKFDDWFDYLNSLDWYKFLRECNEIDDSISVLKKLQELKKLRAIITSIHSNDEMTQKEIAKELGISRSYVSRIEKRATTKILKEFIKNDK